jgi:protein SCO1/2
MDAMTMDFDVRDTAELNNVQPGDTVAFRLCVTDDGAWVEHLRRLAPGAGPVTGLRPATASRLGPGDLFPDAALVDQQGMNFRLADFRGSVLALTFIYTRCPLPTYCPLMSRNFQAAQDLVDQLGIGDRCRFLSISLDSSNDSPGVLSAYAARYGADARRWIFAAGHDEDVRALGAGVGLEYMVADGLIYHNLRTVVLDPAGRIRRVFPGNQWTPQELAAEMRSAASR